MDLKQRTVPKHLVYPFDEFADAHNRAAHIGQDILLDSSVAFVGLARDCDHALRGNLARLEIMLGNFKDWALHIESNDCIDETHDVLADFCFKHSSHASFRYRSLSRERYGAEFGGRRTQALAEYRTDCQEWVRENASHYDYVVVTDWDMQGGWSYRGLLAGFGLLSEMVDAYGMASVSLAEHPTLALSEEKKPIIKTGWTHYDAWALRGLGQDGCYWDNYTAGYGSWAHHFIPPVGSPPVLVSSAFGGMAIYRMSDYLTGRYDGSNDCEHVSFHRSICQAASGRLYLCPSMRTIMHWYE